MRRASLPIMILSRDEDINIATLKTKARQLNIDYELYIGDKIKQVIISTKAKSKFRHLNVNENTLVELDKAITFSGILPSTARDFYIYTETTADTNFTFGDGYEYKINGASQSLFNLKDYNKFTDKTGNVVVKADKAVKVVGVMIVD